MGLRIQQLCLHWPSHSILTKYMLKVEVMEDEATSREQNIRVEKDEDP